jgi:hypothetical protein
MRSLAAQPIRKRLFGLWAAVLLVAPLLAQEQAPATPSDSSSQEAPRATPVFASLERAWVVGNVDSVLGHFGKRKVFLSLPEEGGPAGGLYSRNQSYFILKDLFDTTHTEEFSFVSIRLAEEQPGTAIGRAERTFRRRDSSKTVQDRIFFSLVQEDARWVVAEIKSVR